MFMLNQEPRYQATRGARYAARPLTLLQWFVLKSCEGPMTLEELVWATRRPAQEVAAVLKFLRAHGLVRTVARPSL